jgi:glutathione S-transferase
MKLYHSQTSPYVRKCLVAAHHLGLLGRIEKLASAAHPVNRDQTIIPHNPLGKVPTFIADDGTVLYDSRVICEYLNDLAKGSLFPTTAAARWRALTDQALADGILDAALLVRYELMVREESGRSQAWTDGQMDKIRTGLARFEQRIDAQADRLDIGTIALGCVLGYLDFRFADLGWRKTNPKLARWYEAVAATPAMQATQPA